jgi:hypothetical protein
VVGVKVANTKGHHYPTSLLGALAGANWPLFKSPEESRYRMGEQEIVQREFLVQDPDGYLLRFA